MRYIATSICMLVFVVGALAQTTSVKVVDNKGSINKLGVLWSPVTVGSANIYNTDLGLVGIGTTTPSTNLHVAGTTLLELAPVSSATAAYTPPSVYSGAVVTQTVMDCEVSLPSPADTKPGRLFTLANAAGSTFNLSCGGITITPGRAAIFVWNGSGWSVPTSKVDVFLSDLQAANKINTIDNLNFAQTWNWNTASTTNPLTLASTSLTSGNLFSLSSTNSAHAGTALKVSSGATAPTAGIVNFGFTGAHAGSGVQIDDATIAGAAQTINATGAYTGTGLWNLNANAATTGTVANISANALTTGSALKISSSNSALSSTNGLLNVSNTGASTSGFIAKFNANSTADRGLYVLANGRVGVNTSTPQFALDVVDNVSARIKVYANTAGYTAELNLVTKNFTNAIYTNDGDGSLRFWATADHLAVLQNGNVGIGTIAPSTSLHVAGTTLLELATASNATATYTPSSSYTGAIVTQTVMDCAVSLPSPTETKPGRLFTLGNATSSTFNLSCGGIIITPGRAGIFVWNGSAWSVPTAKADVPLSALIASTTNNTIDNLGYAQTWKWNTASTTNPLTLSSTSLTSGNLFSLSSTNASHTGTALNVSSAATAPSAGIVNFGFTGAHTGSGMLINDATTAGAAQTINATGAYTGTGLWNLNANSATTGTLASISANALTTGSGLTISSSNSTLNSTNGLLNVSNTGASTSGFIAKFNANSATAGSGMYVLASGAVGIGTTAPSTALHIAGNAPRILLQNTNTVGGTAEINFSNNGLYNAVYTDFDGSLKFYNKTLNNNTVAVLQNGNVGIGTVAPGVKLEVNGAGKFTGNLQVNGVLSTPSDMRLKTKIETLTGVLAKINQLRGVRYEYKNQQRYASGTQIGVIAQELQKVFPELVVKGKDGYFSVNYSQLTGVLLQAVKEQQSEIDKLKEQMEVVMKKLGLEK